MKKNGFTLLLFIIIGLLAGSLLSHLLEPVSALHILTNAAELSWHPQADLNMIKYDLNFQVKLNLISILGLVCAIWIYRKL